ncbi:conserved hypothetical protein [delta proteobacterium NaphS2]|nr:conserved hypothetical protein [delta proteobacterium NaphS2]
MLTVNLLSPVCEPDMNVILNPKIVSKTHQCGYRRCFLMLLSKK